MVKPSSSAPVKQRRSSRLKDREVAASKALPAGGEESAVASHRKRRKLADGTAAPVRGHTRDADTPSVDASQPSGSGTRRLQRITPAQLDRREKRLDTKEVDLNTRSAALEDRSADLAEREVAMMSQLAGIAEREIQSTLKHLEEHFTCSLCYEVLAAPYSLNPAHCGHTFCSLCILKWFFSRLHRACGGWHESVDCPICRGLLIITPENTPRLSLTFPFVPNRIAASVINALVDKLAAPPLTAQAKIKKEEGEGAWSSQAKKKERGKGCVRKRDPSEEKEALNISDMPDISAWREGGQMRTEWLKKDREGKREMAFLLNNWSTMGAHEFISMKQRLAV